MPIWWDFHIGIPNGADGEGGRYLRDLRVFGVWSFVGIAPGLWCKQQKHILLNIRAHTSSKAEQVVQFFLLPLIKWATLNPHFCGKIVPLRLTRPNHWVQWGNRDTCHLIVGETRRKLVQTLGFLSFVCDKKQQIFTFILWIDSLSKDRYASFF